MSDIITEAVAALREKIDGEFDGSAKFEIEGEGSVVVDGAGVREGSDGDETDIWVSGDSGDRQYREIGITSGSNRTKEVIDRTPNMGLYFKTDDEDQL